jgi:carboxylesterase type B
MKLNEGVIKGHVATIPQSVKKFYAFQQIPYAAPPVGELRFQPPQPVPKWEGVLDATKNTKICYQIGPNSDKESEDCLYLNVYTPQVSRLSKNLITVLLTFSFQSYRPRRVTHLYQSWFIFTEEVS